MTTFWEMSGAIPLFGKLRLVLEQERGVSFAISSSLRVIARQGEMDGRTVTDFRVFDPASLVATGDQPRNYDDLDPAEVLHAGYLAKDGTIVLSP
jgi:hypothetical protein